MISDKAGNIKDWSNNELRGGGVKIEITYHFVIPSAYFLRKTHSIMTGVGWKNPPNLVYNHLQYQD